MRRFGCAALLAVFKLACSHAIVRTPLAGARIGMLPFRNGHRIDLKNNAAKPGESGDPQAEFVYRDHQFIAPKANRSMDGI